MLDYDGDCFSTSPRAAPHGEEADGRGGRQDRKQEQEADGRSSRRSSGIMVMNLGFEISNLKSEQFYLPPAVCPYLLLFAVRPRLRYTRGVSAKSEQGIGRQVLWGIRGISLSSSGASTRRRAGYAPSTCCRRARPTATTSSSRPDRWRSWKSRARAAPTSPSPARPKTTSWSFSSGSRTSRPAAPFTR